MKHNPQQPQRYLKRYSYIDSLRGIAILLVIISHVDLYSNVSYPLWLNKVAEIYVGPRGVQLFYVVSAFTLCLSLSKRKTIEKHSLRNFYIRRFFRIAPLFYLAIIYYLWQEGFWNQNPSHFSLLNILTTFTFTNGISPAWINNIVTGSWSIAVETTFYLLFPFLFYKLKTFKTALVTTLIAMVLMQLLRLYLLSLPIAQHDFGFQTYTFEFFPSQFPVFLMGLTIFLFIHEKIKNSALLFVGCIVLIIVQALLPIKLIAGHYIYSILFTLFLFYLSKHPVKLLVNPIVEFIGKISFSLYLCHVGVYYWLNLFGLSKFLPANPYANFSLRFVLLLLFSSLIATILYFTVERTGIIIGKKIINKYEKVTTSYITTSARTW